MTKEKPLKSEMKKGEMIVEKTSFCDFLSSPLNSLKRVGPALEKNLLRLIAKNSIFDLLLHRPLRAEKVEVCLDFSKAQNEQLVIIKAKVEAHIKPANTRQPHKILCRTLSGYLHLIFFKIYPSQIEKLPVGANVAVLGYLKKTLVENQITHPLAIIDAAKINELPKINVIYPLTQGITLNFLRQKIQESLRILKTKNCEEWIDLTLVKKENWPNFILALEQIHNPQNDLDLSEQNKARQRLAFDEMLSWQLAMLLVKQSENLEKNLVQIKKNYADEFLKTLPFQPTNGQLKAAQEIKNDVISNKKMRRLLQGDVGSGKTILAIYACLLAFSQNKQSCVIVPISLLAEQHFQYFKKLLTHLKINIEILSSKQTKKQKELILKNLKEGKIDILIATHAVLQDNVIFKNLKLAVIDEQHRFGVMQRLKLVEKGDEVDVLLMSATPIPRSLMMAMYSDMDISILSEKPAGRLVIETLIASQKRQEEIISSARRALDKGEKIYWICPAIEEGEDIDLVSSEQKYKQLCEIFGAQKLRLIHGKMKESEKEKSMQEFKNSTANSGPQILVATTVIEVGVDVSDATIIIIENAENFGLSQLHQLRGRVGRSDKQSYCILLYGKKYGQKGQKRLNIMRQSNDGFFIAKEDMKMRGSGELLGTRQSGVPEFRIANLDFDSTLLKISHKQAQIILQKDPKLSKIESKKYRDLLKLFNYEDCLKILSGG